MILEASKIPPVEQQFVREETLETEERIINPLYILLWLGLALWMGINHEPFADEAQAYLIARDAGVQDILSSVSRTEGTPALWFFWLKFLNL